MGVLLTVDFGCWSTRPKNEKRFQFLITVIKGLRRTRSCYMACILVRNGSEAVLRIAVHVGILLCEPNPCNFYHIYPIS